jgi:hypothetical protein
LKRPNDPEYQCIAAVVHTQFGELAEAFRYLEKAVDFGYSIPDIEADRELDNLRADSQYRALFVGRQSAGR